jgi:hypothetical protein
MSMQWADLDSDDSDDEAIVMATQHAGLNDGTVQVNIYTLFSASSSTSCMNMPNSYKLLSHPVVPLIIIIIIIIIIISIRHKQSLRKYKNSQKSMMTKPTLRPPPPHPRTNLPTTKKAHPKKWKRSKKHFGN